VSHLGKKLSAFKIANIIWQMRSEIGRGKALLGRSEVENLAGGKRILGPKSGKSLIWKSGGNFAIQRGVRKLS